MTPRKEKILYGRPLPVNYNEGAQSLGEFSMKRLTEQGDSVVLINGLTSEECSAIKLRNESIRVADCLLHLGIKSGDVVGICADNCMEFAYLLFGTFFVGATVSPMNSTYSERELRHAVNLSKPKIVFASKMTLNSILKVAEKNSFIKKIFYFGDPSITNQSNPIVQDYDTFIRNPQIKTNANDFKCEPLDINETTALILYSSGTTGLPKGVELTQKNILIALAQHFHRQSAIEDHHIPIPITLSIIPWYHTYGCVVLMGSVLRNIKLVFLSKFDERTFFGCIESNVMQVLLMRFQKYKANKTFLVPPLMVFLAKHANIDEYDLSSLKMISCGSAPLSKDIQDTVERRLNIPIIRQGYGMTEGTVGFTAQDDDNPKSGSVGKLHIGLCGRVIDVETGAILGPNERGELQFKGSSVMKGYIGDPIATNNTIDKDGWLHTGDIGYYDDDGEYFVVDRLKELIKYKGFQVPPAEIEGLLLQYPKVSDVGVIGVPDERVGELPMAFVVKQAGVDVTEKEIIDFVAATTSSAKRLHGGVRFVNEIPKSASGKILRRELREMAKKILSKL